MAPDYDNKIVLENSTTGVACPSDGELYIYERSAFDGVVYVGKTTIYNSYYLPNGGKASSNVICPHRVSKGDIVRVSASTTALKIEFVPFKD